MLLHYCSFRTNIKEEVFYYLDNNCKASSAPRHSLSFKVPALLIMLSRFNVRYGKAPNAVSRGLPSGATRVFILKSPALGWPTPCGTSRYTLVDECHALRV